MRFFLAPLVGLVGFSLCAAVVLGDAAQQAEEPSGSWITFLSRREFPVNTLYKARPDGSDVTLVYGGKIEKAPVLDEDRSLYRDAHWTRQSPNGKWFASWAQDALKPGSRQDAQHFMIHVGAIDRSWSRVLAPDGQEQLAWAPDSRRIAYSVLSGRVGRLGPGSLRSQLPSTEVVAVGIDGSEMGFVFEQPGLWTVQDWSPDGKRLLLWHMLTEIPSESTSTRIAELVEYDLARALASRKERAPGQFGRGDKWPATVGRYLKTLVLGSASLAPNETSRYSPDGSKIAFVYVDAARPGVQVRVDSIPRWHWLGKLAIYDVATGAIKTIANPPDGIWTGPICWSPDGREILITRYLGPDDRRERSEGSPSMGIWAITVDGKHQRFITTGWSPDWR